ncbi:hypothetical protein ACTXT7_016312 [Hymenolepis weldensis]
MSKKLNYVDKGVLYDCGNILPLRRNLFKYFLIKIDLGETNLVSKHFALNVIPAPSAEMILKGLSERQILRKEHLTLFSTQHVNLHSVFFSKITLTPSSISILKDFTLYNISVLNVSGIDLANLVDSFSKETKENLHTFNVENMKIGRRRRRIAFEALEQLHNLQVLKMIRTNLDSKYLRIIVRSLPRLTYLDISETTVDNICCLKELKDRLKVLIMHLPKCNRRRILNRTLSTILELKELRILDVSTYMNGGLEPYANANQLIKPKTLPHLRYFDISGNPFSLDIQDIR